MRSPLPAYLVLIAVAVVGILAVARSPGPKPCPKGEICPAPPACVAPTEARATARAAMRGPRKGLDPFGFNDGSVLAEQATAEEVIALHEQVGATLIRFALDWRRVEPQPGTYDFSAEDEIYCAALARGVAPLIEIAAAPTWAAKPAGSCPQCLRPPAREHLDALGKLARIVAARYPGAVAIEAWNEPNLSLFWESPDPAAYVEVLRAIHAGVKRSNPSMAVLGGSLANASGEPGSVERLRRFIDGIYAAGGGSLMDALSIHPYPVFPVGHTDERYGPMLKLVRRIASKHGHRDQRLWITELGLRTQGGVDHADAAIQEAGVAVSAEQQAASMATLYRRASRDPQIEAVVFHTLMEPDGRVASSGGHGWVAKQESGLVAKPIWCRIQAVARRGTPCRQPQPPPGA